MIVPNSQYVVVEVNKATYDKYSPAFSTESVDRDQSIDHNAFEGTVYAIGDEGFSQNPVAAASDNQFVFARMPNNMDLKKGNHVICNHFPTYGLAHNNKYLLFIYKEGVLCTVRNEQEEINLFNQEMPPVVVS